MYICACLVTSAHAYSLYSFSVKYFDVVFLYHGRVELSFFVPSSLELSSSGCNGAVLHDMIRYCHVTYLVMQG